MNYLCAACQSPIASKKAYCDSCGAEPSPGGREASLPYGVILLGLVLGIGGTIWGLHFWRTMHTGGNSISITTQATYDATPDLGVSIYTPSSPALPDGQNHVLHMTKGNTDSARVEFVTYDSVDQVLQYYQNEMGPQAVTKRSLVGATIRLNKDSIAGTDEIVVTLMTYIPDHNPAVNKKTLIQIVHTRTAAGS